MRVVIVEQHGGEHVAHVPFDVAGEHAQQDMGADPAGSIVEDGADLEIDDLAASEGALHGGELFVCAHHVLGAEVAFGHTGADDTEAVEPGLLDDVFVIALEVEAVFGDLHVEVPGHLVFGNDLADAQADPVASGEAAFVAPGCGADCVEVAFDGPQEDLALARVFLGEQRVAAHEKAFAGKVFGGDLGKVALIEQRALQRPVLDQVADRRRAQGADPVEPGGLDVFADAGAGEHAPVADQNHPGEAEAGTQHVDPGAQGGGVSGVAREHFDRHRATLRIAQQAEDDLCLAAFSVTGVAMARQRAATALEPGRRDVVEHQGAVGEMTPGQAPLNRILASPQPVHRAVERIGIDRTQRERFAQRVAQRLVAQAARGRQPGARCEDAGHDHGQDQRALT